MLLVPEADRLIRCPQWQQCVISISVLPAIRHRLLRFSLLPVFILNGNQNKSKKDLNLDVIVPPAAAGVQLYEAET